jgi:hypothetical protein
MSDEMCSNCARHIDFCLCHGGPNIEERIDQPVIKKAQKIKSKYVWKIKAYQKKITEIQALRPAVTDENVRKILSQKMRRFRDLINLSHQAIKDIDSLSKN